MSAAAPVTRTAAAELRTSLLSHPSAVPTAAADSSAHGKYLQPSTSRRGSVNDVAAATADVTVTAAPDVEVAAAAPETAKSGREAGSRTDIWLRRFRWGTILAKALGCASVSSRRWRCFVNAAVAFVVVFEALWWAFVVWVERRQPEACVVGAALDAGRGALYRVISACHLFAVRYISTTLYQVSYFPKVLSYLVAVF